MFTQNQTKDKTICFVLPYWITNGPGGAEYQSYLISEKLMERGWKVEVIYKNDKQIKGVIEEYVSDDVVYRSYKKSEFKIIEAIRIFILFLKTQSLFYYNRTDARLMRGVCGIYCKLFRKKLIYAIANDMELYSKPLYDSYRLKKISIKNRIKLIDSRITEKLINRNVFKADYVIAQTHFQKREFDKKFGFNCHVIRNSFTFPEKVGVEKENIILWVSNVRFQKRPEVLAKIADSLDLSGWKLVMIGNPNEFGHIIDSIKNKNFLALGPQSRDETNKWFEKSKIFINTSSFEGFPNSFIQAWYYKSLVISLAINTDSLLDNDKFGIFCDDNFDKFRLSIARAMKNYDFKDKLDQAMSFALEEFQLHKNVNKLEESLMLS